MDVFGPRAAFEEHVAPRLEAPAAALLLDALPRLRERQRVLEVSGGLGTLTHALIERAAADAGAVDLVIAAREDLAPATPSRPFVRYVRASHERLPVEDGSFDVIAGNLTLGARAYDAARAASMMRALAPDGTLVLTVLLAGSFDELFDVLTEVSEHAALPRLRAAVTDARRELYEEDELVALLEQAGLEVTDYGEEQRGLFYPSGAAVTDDPLLSEALAAGWLGGALDGEVRREAARFLDTYYEGRRFCVSVRTGVLRARRRV